MNRLASDLLGRHVAHGPHHCAGLRLAGRRRRARLFAGSHSFDLRQAEVENLEVAVSRDEQVLGLQVPMDHTLLVGRGEAFGHLERVVDSLLVGDWTRLELASQRFALGLRDGVRNSSVGPEVVNGEDVRMRRTPRRPSPRGRTAAGVRVGRQRSRQDLDRDVPPEARVARAPDFAHPPRAERREDLVRTGPARPPSPSDRSWPCATRTTRTRRPRRPPPPATAAWPRSPHGAGSGRKPEVDSGGDDSVLQRAHHVSRRLTAVPRAAFLQAAPHDLLQRQGGCFGPIPRGPLAPPSGSPPSCPRRCPA